jgi:hypothetical protein
MKKSNFGNSKLVSQITELNTGDNSNISAVSITIGIKKHGGYADKIPPQPPLTKTRFEALLTKAAQPLKPETKEK